MKKYILSILIVLLALNGFAQQVVNDTETLPPMDASTTTVVAKQSITLTDGFSSSGYSNFHAFIDPLAPIGTNGSGEAYNGYTSGEFTNHNYVKSYTLFKDNQVTNADNLTSANSKISYQYFDGFGRPLQTVLVKASPEGRDIVQPVKYDAFGRQAESYLPYTVRQDGSSEGGFRKFAIDEQKNFYDHYYGEGDYAKSRVEFDGSPLNMPEKTFQHGQDWDGLYSEMSYDGVDGAENIIKWKVVNNNLVNDGTYTSNKLVKVHVQDEDGRFAIVYNDLEGRQILKKTTVNGADVLTYSVYDEFGRLRYVLTPRAVPELTLPSYSSTDAIIKELCYYYEYNARHLMVKKQLPGADYISMTYDNLDRLQYTQDAEQRNTGDRSFVEYDALGRPYASGTENSQGTKQYESYTYYDNYSAFGAEYAFDASHAYYAKSNSVKGMAVGSKTRVMDWDAGSDMPEWLGTVTYIDDRGRPIQTVSKNHKGGIDITSTKYLYDGTVVETRMTHRVVEPVVNDDIVVIDKFEYDAQGYLLRQKQQLNSEPEVTVSELEYYETGQVKTNKIHSENGSSFVQEVDYQYNIKGWLTHINNPESLGSDLFGMKLEYTEGASKEYNGYIKAAKWASATYTDLKSYAFDYDMLGRLVSANYSDGGTRDYSVGVSYDLNGNITGLTRQGRFSNGTFGTIDNLSYTYKNGGLSNQLDRVDDNNTSNYQDYGFRDQGAFAANEYSYDDNGNMLSDANRKITQVTYNKMDLPVEITITGATQDITITNTYLTGGAKLRKVTPDGKTDYVGSFIYEDDELKYIQTGGGRIVVDGSSYERQYFLTDHLGNARVVFDTQGNILQEDSYYPFGMAQDGLNYVNGTLLDIDNKNKYLYNGKEQDDKTGYYEYGFRQYDAQLGRWHVIDPMAEKYGTQSPYHFAGNNPFNFIEINGAEYQDISDIITELWNNTSENGVGTWSSGEGGGTYSYYNSLDAAYDAGAIPGLRRTGHFKWRGNASFRQNLRAYFRHITGGNVAPVYLRVGWEISTLDMSNDYFSPDGTWLESSGTGSQVYVRTEKGDKLITDVRMKPNAVKRIFAYYNSDLNVDDFIICQECMEGAAGFRHGQIKKDHKTGEFFSNERPYIHLYMSRYARVLYNNKFDIISMLVHEKYHMEEDNYYNSKSGRYISFTHTHLSEQHQLIRHLMGAYLVQLTHPSWKHVSPEMERIAYNALKDLIAPIQHTPLRNHIRDHFQKITDFKWSTIYK